MDMISNYKIEALENMKQTVNTLTAEVDKAQKYLDKSNQTTVLEVSKELNTKKITNQSNTVDIDIWLSSHVEGSYRYKLAATCYLIHIRQLTEDIAASFVLR